MIIRSYIMIENKILRANARNQLGGRIFEMPWLAMLAVFFVYGAVMTAAAGTTLGIGAIIISGPMLYGVNRICVKQVRGRDIVLDDAISGFKECFVGSFLLSFITALYTLLWTLLFIVPGIVKSYAYAMAPYILQDSPNLNATECLDKSQKMMKGNKWQLFCLDFSFVGWYIVGALCLGVGTLWVTPYHNMARANFYMALKAKEESEYAESVGFEPVNPFN